MPEVGIRYKHTSYRGSTPHLEVPFPLQPQTRTSSWVAQTTLKFMPTSGPRPPTPNYRSSLHRSTIY